jgi:Peptidase family M50
VIEMMLAAMAVVALFAATRIDVIAPAISPVLFGVGFLSGGFVGTAVHEIGHFLCALLVSIPVKEVLVGGGRMVFSCRIGETSLQLRRNPFRGGIVVPYHVLVFCKYRTVFFLGGGLLADAVFVALLIGVSEAVYVPADLGAVLAGAVIWKLYTVMYNVMPRDVTIQDHKTSTDTRLILRTLRGPRSGPTQYGLWFADYLNKYSVGAKLAIPTSAAAARICHYYLQGRWADENARRDAKAAFMRELKRGGLTREVELLVLESLSTDALIFSDPSVRPYLDFWSSRALGLAPAVTTVRGTRGGVLVELGRYAEAKPFLEPLTSAEETPLDRVLGHVFLARAEHGLGDMEAAQRHVSEARKVCTEGTQHSAIAAFVERVAAEVEAA